jgi:hypothetical protein
MYKKSHNGFAIALAWPQTYCKQAGAWYDAIMGGLGISKNNYYKAGHAALVLVDHENSKCHYFDFGRYHAPFQHGRVRSVETDHELAINTIPLISNDGSTLGNFKEILTELQGNPACHGEGALYASYCPVNFKRAFEKATEMQKLSPIRYGPFQYKGSNCSRFVNAVILAGKPDWKARIKLRYLVPLTPTPLNNVNALNDRLVLPKFSEVEMFYPAHKRGRQFLKDTLPPPQRHPHIPEHAQWLSGEGAGSWFVIKLNESKLLLTRYAPSGEIECEGTYQVRNSQPFSKDFDFKVTHPSNCKIATLMGAQTELSFERI